MKIGSALMVRMGLGEEDGLRHRVKITVVDVAGNTKPLVGIGWEICHLLCTNRLQKNVL